MAKRTCPECGILIDNKTKTCPNCGCPMQPVSKNNKVIIVLAIVIISLGIFVGIFFTKIYPIQQSQKSYEQAVECEGILDYEGAIYYYSQVKAEDSEHYSKAVKKVEELREYVKASKFAAAAFIALKNTGHASSLSDLLSFKINVDKQQATCRINGTNYAVLANKFDMDEFHEFYTEKHDSETGFYTIEFTPQFEYTGLFAYATNAIRQQTSDMMYDTITNSTSKDLINKDLIQHYIDLYQEQSNISILLD